MDTQNLISTSFNFICLVILIICSIICILFVVKYSTPVRLEETIDIIVIVALNNY